jgi:nucleoside-diphosphate-sugar epimerase
VRILVTGAAGYLGSALIRKLMNDGYHVVGLDTTAFGNPHSAKPGWAGGAVERIADVRHADAIKMIVDDQKIDTVVHLAAILTVDACEKDPQTAHSIHVDGTRSAFSVDGTRNIHISTGAVFGEGGMPVEEDSPDPHTVYAVTKAAGEQIALGRDAVVLRLNYLGGYAPGTRWVETVNFLAREAAQKGMIEVWEPHITHPFTHVLDAVDAIRATLESDVRHDIFHILSANLERACLGAYAAEKDVGVTTKLVGHLQDDLIMTTEKAERILGWKPKRMMSDAFNEAWDKAKERPRVRA